MNFIPKESPSKMRLIYAKNKTREEIFLLKFQSPSKSANLRNDKMLSHKIHRKLDVVMERRCLYVFLVETVVKVNITPLHSVF